MSKNLRILYPSDFLHKEKEVETLEKHLEKAVSDYRKEAANIMLVCSQCGYLSAIGKATLVQCFLYDPNTGSPNGGFHNRGEKKFECLACKKQTTITGVPDIIGDEALYANIREEEIC